MKVLIAAGPTREFIDPVRFISNRSSGVMGREIAIAARVRKHTVTVILGPCDVKLSMGIKVVKVESARDMYGEVLNKAKSADVIFMCSAVADYTPQKRLHTKLKKTDALLTLNLKRTSDILAKLGEKYSGKKVIVGFSAESRNIVKNAERKLKQKKCNIIVANRISKSGPGFESDKINTTVIFDNGINKRFGVILKKKLAHILIKEAENYS
ncbi:MAG: phosphopantothenoylcysteine decarboxylase [Candidatus Aureabacteria bacterium]|nr:phosphopantothenoylcysteine decarboxylase [Candidatus Auribacterota bacterium]